MFVSHSGRDTGWAEWMAYQLQQEGFAVELDLWHWHPGESFVQRMNSALERADVVLSLWSSSYFEFNRYTTVEWSNIVASRGISGSRLVPIRLEDVQPPPVLRDLIHRDIFGLTEKQARVALLTAVAGKRNTYEVPIFPGNASTVSTPEVPRFPNTLPSAWNVPPRSMVFTGRDDVLASVHASMKSSDIRAHAFTGLSGVGKTAVAAEYAHRYSGNYDVVWWIDADVPGLVEDQLAALATRLDLVPPTADVKTGLAHALLWLRQHDRWLLIFDGAEPSAVTADWYPQGPGHVLIASRETKWNQVVPHSYIDVLDELDSIAILFRLVPELDRDEAKQIAADLGFLPLALVQAGSCLAETGITAAEYIGELRARTVDVLAENVPLDYPHSLAGAIDISVNRLGDDPPARELLYLLAFSAAEPFPLNILAGYATHVLPAGLAERASSPMALRRTAGKLYRSGLLKIARGGNPQMHRLTQLVIRGFMDDVAARSTRRMLADILSAASPGDPEDVSHWPAWTLLAPHVIALLEGFNDQDRVVLLDDFRKLVLDLAQYLYSSGQQIATRRICELVAGHWRVPLGGGHRDFVAIESRLASALVSLGDARSAQVVFERVLRRRVEMLGSDHPDSLSAANNLGVSLTRLDRFAEAHELLRETLKQRLGLLGADHPQSLRTAHNAGVALRLLGRHEEAEVMLREVVARRSRMLGPTHPYTLTTAAHLGAALAGLGRYAEARHWLLETLDAQRRVLGHPHDMHDALVHEDIKATVDLIDALVTEEQEQDR